MNQDQARAAVAGSRLVTSIGSAPRGHGHQEHSTELQRALGVSVDSNEAVHTALQSMVSLAVIAVDGAASCGVTVTVGGRTHTVVHSDARTLLVDAEQYMAGDGPCLHAARVGQVVRAGSTDAAQQWPVFAAAAADENIHSFFAAPLHFGETTFGSLNLYGEGPASFTDTDVETVTALTRTLSRTLGDYRRFDQLLDQVNGLRTAIDDRAPIEQVKGMLMAFHRIDADAAFTLLAEHSQNTNRKVRDLAVDLVDSLLAGAPEEAGSARSLLSELPRPAGS